MHSSSGSHRAWLKPLLVLAIVIALLAGACGGDDGGGGASDAPSDDTETTTAEVETNPDAVLRVAANLLTQQGASLDPRFSRSNTDLPFLQAAYATLLTIEPGETELSPNLAESWEVVDPQTVNVTLRDDALFHDGRPVTSADVAATIDAMKANAAAGTNTVNPAVALIDQIEQLDDKSFVVHMSEPAVASLLEMFTDRPFMIVPAETSSTDQTTENPIGTGPFRIVSYTPGERIVMEKFEDYFMADQVRLGGIEFIHLAEGQPMNNALLAGDVDLAELDLSAYQAVQNNDDIASATRFSDGQVLYLDMCKDYGTIFEDVRVRQAVAYAIDEDVINDAAYDGLGEGADTQIWPESAPEYNGELGDPYPYDPDRARALLEEAGIEEGTQISIWFLNQFSVFEEAALIIQQQLADVGLDVEVVGGDDITGDYWDPSNSGNPAYDSMVVRNQRTGVQKATRWFFEGSQANTCSYLNDELIGLVTDVSGMEPGSDEAISAWHDISEIVADELPLIPFVYEPAPTGWSTRVVGVEEASVWSNLAMGPRWELLGMTD